MMGSFSMAELLKQVALERVFEPKQTVVMQGEPPHAFYYITEGLIQSSITLPEGAENKIMIYYPGIFFGLPNFFAEVPRMVTFTAVKYSRVYIIDRATYSICCKLCPDFKDLLLVSMAEDASLLMEQACNRSLMNTDYNLARFICRQISRGHQSVKHGVMYLELSQDFIAGVLGLSRVAVNRALKKFERNGWLKLGYRSIAIVEPEQIQAFAYGTDVVSPLNRPFKCDRSL